MNDIDITNMILKNSLVDSYKVRDMLKNYVIRLCNLLKGDDSNLHICDQIDTSGYIRMYLTKDDMHRYYIFHLHISDITYSPIKVKVFDPTLKQIKYLSHNIIHNKDIYIFLDRFIYFLCNQEISKDIVKNFAYNYAKELRSDDEV